MYKNIIINFKFLVHINYILMKMKYYKKHLIIFIINIIFKIK